MACIISRVNPVVADATYKNFDVVVSYDIDNERFCVLFVATNSGYWVSRNELVGWDYKYTGRIEDRILDTFDADEDVFVLITNSADNEINLIWMANCDIF